MHLGAYDLDLNGLHKQAFEIHIIRHISQNIVLPQTEMTLALKLIHRAASSNET